MVDKKKKKHPLVSVCTPTFNRRPFIPIMFDCFRNQNYPKDRIEWIIVDDGTDKIGDLIEKANIPQIKYFSIDKKMSLGEKRNYMHKQAKGSIIVYMDDDDYYPPDRISHAVERLTSSPTALCAGSSEMYIYFKHIKKMYQSGPYGPNHATAGTFAFKAELLKQTQYENHAALAEEKAFLKNYTIPFVQLDPMKTILVFSHEHNTFDKRELLKNPHPDIFKESPKTVDMFIKYKDEEHIKKFFLKDIDKLLANYEPGLPKMKPDVLKQIKEIDEERSKMMQQQNAYAPIMLQQPGKEPVALTSQQVVEMIQQQQQQINSMTEYIKQLEFSKNIPQSPFAQPQSPFAQPQSPFAQPQSPFAPPQSPFAQPQSPFSNNSELEKENNELKEKYNSIYNELQRYKVTVESQKSIIEKLKESTKLPEKHVKFQQNKYVVFG
jgi:glycosyltransferase involved in cell wall biosynthesis